MWRNGQRVIEYTMTHRIGPGGQSERYERPDVVREMVTRIRKWGAGNLESCQSCASGPAVAVRCGQALCSRCSTEYASRHGWSEGAKPSVVRATDDHDSGKQLRGHMIVFNDESVDLGGFVEIIRPRAADRLEREKPDLRGLWNHDSAIVLGRYSAGTMRYKKVTRGVAVEIDPPRWAHGHVESIERRDVTGMSFGFWALDDKWSYKRDDDGNLVSITREIFDMNVIEGSAVGWPAYTSTDIRVVDSGVRSAWDVEAETAHRLRVAL